MVNVQEWVIRVDAELRSDENSQTIIDENNSVSIFRVPTHLLEVSQESYRPQFFSLGLYGYKTREVSRMDAHRQEFASIFKNITGESWEQICSKVVGNSNEDVQSWVKYYDDFKLESLAVDQGTRKDLAVVGTVDHRPINPGLSVLDCIKSLLTLDAVFVVCFIQARHQLRCDTCKDKYPVLNKKVKKEAKLLDKLHLILLDMFLFGNQIPLRLTEKVVNMMHMPKEASQPAEAPPPINQLQREQYTDPFNLTVGNAVDMIYCNLPGFADRKDFRGILKEIDYRNCRHLLHCLYKVICYKSPNSGAPEDSQVQVKRGASTKTTNATGGDEETQWRWRKGKQKIIEIPRSPVTIANGPSTSSALPSTSHTQEGNTGRADAAPRDAEATAQAQGEVVISTGDSQQINTGRAEPSPAARVPPTPAVQSEMAPADRQQGNTSGIDEAAAQVAPAIATDEGTRHANHRRRYSCLAFFFKCLTCTSSKGSDQGQHHHRSHIPTLTKLQEAGIRVQVGPGNLTKRISDVSFKTGRRGFRGTLYLPAFEVYDETEILLRNLLTYEYVVEGKNDLMSYIHLMDNLIDTEQDVQLLKDRGVFTHNSLGSDKKVADMWNSMLTGYVINLSPSYQKLFDSISKHYDTKSNKHFEEFRKLYLARPWLTITAVSGAFLVFATLIATLVATVYTVLTYYYGNKQKQ